LIFKNSPDAVNYIKAKYYKMDEQYGERVMAVTAVIKFKINNDFFE